MGVIHVYSLLMQTTLFQKDAVRSKYKEIFAKAYSSLNIEQREAVDIIDGPVMVIAGPGTGKTQILAVRIGKILLETDTQPHNILCLTYTDSATISMRNRLIQIIGPEAHKVHIHTFHSFCNQVIQENLGYFGNFRQLEPLSDLERVDVYKQLMDGLPDDHKLKQLKSNPEFQIKRLRNLFSLMKKENYTEETIIAAIEEYYSELKESPEMHYKRSGKGYVKGDFKQREFEKIVHKMEDLRAGAALLSKYSNIMADKERYDYEDMIHWVLKAFHNDEDLLMEYQERYQYFLVDEFQDTNGSQKDLLESLISFWEDAPNAFVVGDDDQAIYKFQGANLGNIRGFYIKYHPKIVVLKKNYRSSQSILDAAMGLIDFNAERMVKDESLLIDKNLEAQTKYKDLGENVHIHSYTNVVQEQAAVTSRIEEQFREVDDLSGMAVIYRNHKQVERIVDVLEKKNIPLNMKRKMDILPLPLVHNLLNILTYVNAQYLSKGYTDRQLFEIMHYSFFGIRAHDISLLIWETRNKRILDDGGQDHGGTPLARLITDTERMTQLGIGSIDEITRLNVLVDKWVSDVGDVTVQVLFQNILNEGGILHSIFQRADNSWLLQVLNTLFDLIKDESTKNPELSLQDFLEMIDKMKENNLPLQVNKVVSSSKGIHLLTAHASKGLEFDEVHILGANKTIWDNKRKGNRTFSYPPNINGDNDSNIEDERRLFYVGMTRAKRKLTMSYGLSREDGKELGSSQFIDELVGSTELMIQPINLPEQSVNDFQYHLLLQKKQPKSFLDHARIDQMLEGYQLSVTGLNKYLQCPLTFYFESVLRVPMARTKYLGFGRGIHHALEHFYSDVNKNESTNIQTLLQHFEIGMSHHRSHFTEKEFRDMTVYGRQVLESYFNEYLRKRNPDIQSYELEVKIDHAEYSGVPIKGILDRVDVYGPHVIVTDYKTGNPAYRGAKLRPPSDRDLLGGDYWRQIVFYQILLENSKRNNWNMIEGVMDFVEPDRKTGAFTRKSFEVSQEQIRIVGEQIKKVWDSIHNHEFEKGCGEDDCIWCNFVENEYVLSDTLIKESAEKQ